MVGYCKGMLTIEPPDFNHEATNANSTNGFPVPPGPLITDLPPNFSIKRA